MSYVKINDLLIGSNTRLMLTAVNDTGSGSVTKRSESYFGFDGCEDFDITFNARTVTVAGTLFGESLADIAALKRLLTEACNPKEEIQLCYNDGCKSYYSPARAEELPVFSKVTNVVYRFIVYFKLCKFWWYGEKTSVPVMKRENNLFGTFALPRAFTKATIGSTVYNGGAVSTPPLFAIKVLKARTADFTVSNVTYDRHNTIESYTAEIGETITVDCEYCTVTSDKNGNLAQYITEDSTFFRLEKGKNEIAFSTADEACAVYREKYMGV